MIPDKAELAEPIVSIFSTKGKNHILVVTESTDDDATSTSS